MVSNCKRKMSKAKRKKHFNIYAIQKKGDEYMSKFKVGDKVRAIDGYAKGYEGVVVETNSGIGHGMILCRFKNFDGHNGGGFTKRGKNYDTTDHYYVSEDVIELISRPNETIVIYRKDDKVIALDKRTGKKTEAKCHPDDEFDFSVGAKLAFERLLEKKEQYYNGKIIFTKGDGIFKTGHIYEVVDGKILNAKIQSKKLPCGDRRFLDLDDIKDYFTEYGKRKNQQGWSVETLELIEVLDD